MLSIFYFFYFFLRTYDSFLNFSQQEKTARSVEQAPKRTKFIDCIMPMPSALLKTKKHVNKKNVNVVNERIPKALMTSITQNVVNERIPEALMTSITQNDVQAVNLILIF